MDELIKHAHYYKSFGYSIIAVGANKESIHSWKKYQKVIIDDYALKYVFNRPAAWGIAIVCGIVSGNLEVIDLDERNNLDSNLFEQFIFKLNDYNPKLCSQLTIASTKNNGYHFFYRCIEIGNNCHLARRPCTDIEIASNPDQKVKVLIESKSEGGYVIVYPTPGYQFIQNNLENVPTISPSERIALLEIARSFNKNQVPEPVLNNPGCAIYGEESPFNDFNFRGDIIGLLERHGWKVVRTTPMKTYFKRPGDTDHKTSGDFHHGLGLFGVFTTSTVFIPRKGYRPSAVYAILECGGDFKLAAKRLLEEGYGIPYKNMF
jgi:hypothetical protein